MYTRDVHISGLTSKERLQEAINKYFEKDEKAVVFTTCSEDGTRPFLTQFLIISNKRVLVWYRKLLKESEIFSIPFHLITRVLAVKSIISPTVTIFYNGKSKCLTFQLRKLLK